LHSHNQKDEATLRHSYLLRYLYNPLTTAAIGILAGALFQIVQVKWWFVLAWILLSLALVRAGAKTLQFIFFSAVIAASLWVGLRFVPKPQPPAKLPTSSEIAEEVLKVLPNTTTQTGSTTTAKPPQSTIPEVSLIFKESALFTPERKRRVTVVINDFYLYLKGLGFPVQKELPPVGVSNYNVQSISGTFPGTIYDQQIYLPKNSLDNSDAIRKVYASYVFRRLFGTFGANSIGLQDYANDETTATLYEVYYASSAVNRDLDRDNDWRGHAWMEALWEIRQKMGKDFTDRAMFYTYKAWDPKPVPGNFEAKFWTRFLAGVWVIDNNGTSFKAVQEILVKRRIPQAS
jgi:membrane protein implicated in regulation of membrane protease activity